MWPFESFLHSKIDCWCVMMVQFWDCMWNKISHWIMRLRSLRCNMWLQSHIKKPKFAGQYVGLLMCWDSGSHIAQSWECKWQWKGKSCTFICSMWLWNLIFCVECRIIVQMWDCILQWYRGEEWKTKMMMMIKIIMKHHAAHHHRAP